MEGGGKLQIKSFQVSVKQNYGYREIIYTETLNFPSTQTLVNMLISPQEVYCVEFRSVVRVKNISPSGISVVFSTPGLSLCFQPPCGKGNQFGMGHRPINQWELGEKFQK